MANSPIGTARSRTWHSQVLTLLGAGLFGALVASACVETSAGSGGETHFLTPCNDDATCLARDVTSRCIEGYCRPQRVHLEQDGGTDELDTSSSTQSSSQALRSNEVRRLSPAPGEADASVTVVHNAVSGACQANDDCGVCEVCQLAAGGDLGACVLAAVGSPCRSHQQTQCTAPDTCDTAGRCLANHAPAGTPCGSPAASECDAPDTCDVRGLCAPNWAPAGTSCGDTSTEECHKPDTCNGSGTCHANPKSAGTVCRASAASCDPTERCDGISLSCPADVWGMVLPRLQAEADSVVVSNCIKQDASSADGGGRISGFASGSTIEFPQVKLDGVDRFEFSMGTASAGGEFDVRLFDPVVGQLLGTTQIDESTGSGSIYQLYSLDIGDDWGGGTFDLFLVGTKNGAAAPDIGTLDYLALHDATCPSCGRCERPVGSTCVPLTAGTTCRAAAGGCDIPEQCDGVSPDCPEDKVYPSDQVCRDAVGSCDFAEFCTGTKPNCPVDRTKPVGTVCESDGDPCTLDTCDGGLGFCRHKTDPACAD